MVKPIARRLGRDADTQVEAVFKGPVCAIRTPSGWKTLNELPPLSSDWNDYNETWCLPPPGRAGGLWSQENEDDIDPLSTLLPFGRDPNADEDEDAPYSNAQFAAYRPQDDLAIIVSSFAELALDGRDVIGRLTDTGARLLLSHEGEPQVTPLSAAGVFKLSIQGGIVTKFLLRLEGVVSAEGRKVVVHQISRTEITRVGTTSLEIGDDVKRKLGIFPGGLEK
jgi:hypothetical protein